LAEEPASEPTAKNYGLREELAQNRGILRWPCGRFEQSDTGESCGVEMAERVGLSSTDLPDARNPINKGLSAAGENRLCTTRVYHFSRPSPSQSAQACVSVGARPRHCRSDAPVFRALTRRPGASSRSWPKHRPPCERSQSSRRPPDPATRQLPRS
jgi:hypothetical protein